MANDTPDNLTQDQHDQILAASTSEEKKQLAVEFGFSEDLVERLDPRSRVPERPQGGLTAEEMAVEPPEDDEGPRVSTVRERPELTGEPLDDDIPIEQATPQEGDDDIPVDVEGRTRPDRPESKNRDLENTRLVQSAIIQNYLDDTPLMEGYLQYRGTENKKSVRDALADAKETQDLDAVREMFLESPGITPEDIMTEAQIAELMEMDISEQGSGPMRNANIYADALVQGRDPEAQAELATDAALYETFIRPIADDISTWDQVSTFAKDLLPGAILWQNNALTNQFFGAQERLKEMAGRFRSLPPEERIEVFPRLRDELIEEVGETRAVRILSQFVDPAGDMGFDEFSNAWAAVDAVDAASVLGGIGLVITRAGRSGKATHALKTAGREEEAADVGAVSVLDETGETARASGVSTRTAHNDALPFNVQGIDPDYTQGLSTKIQERIRRFRQERDERLEGIAAGTSWRREHAPLTKEQSENVALERALNREGIENAQITNRTEEGFDLRYDVTRRKPARDEAGRFTGGMQDEVIRTERMHFNYDPEAGQPWELGAPGRTRQFLESNTSLAGDSNLAADINRALRLDTSGAKVANELVKLQREALSPVLGSPLAGPSRNPFIGARPSLAKIDDVMRTGDREGRVFNAVELNKMGLNERETEAYFNLRNLFDGLHDLRNFEVRRDLVKQGFRNITTRDGQRHIGQTYADSGAARRAINQIEGGRDFVYLDDIGDVRRLDDINLDDMYNAGYQMTRVRDGLRTEQAGKVDLALVRRDQVDNLPMQVLNYKQGYVPRIYDRAAYFVKSVKPTRVDGKQLDMANPKLAVSKGADTETLRMFDNKPDADAFARQTQAELGDDAAERLVVLGDREIERQSGGVAMERGAGPGSGLYTGARADEAIPFGPDGAEAPMLSTFEALTRNIQNVSNFVSRNELRQHWQRQWIETARSLGVRAERYGDIPAKTDSRLAAHLRSLERSIDDWSGIPSDSERFMESAMQNLIDKVAGSKLAGGRVGEAGKRSLHSLKHRDPVATARATAFHALLGWFNPVQLWIQAQGATVAMSMNMLRPDRLTRIMGRQAALSAVDFTENVGFLNRVARQLDISPNDLKKTKELWEKTGYRQSILNTADHAAAIRSYGMGADAMRRAADRGMMFYRMGELFNRRLSFLTAMEEHSRRTGRTIQQLTDEDLGQIMTRTNDFMLNLSKANKAQWQRGPLSLATQFQQPFTKMAETLLGTNKRFTPMERGKILAGQLGLYGVAGVPFGTAAYHAAAGLAGFDEEQQANVDEDTRRLFNGGMTDWLAANMFGADVEVANRSALASGIEDFFYDLMNDQANFLINMPFGAVADRTYSAFKHMNILAAPALEEGQMPNASVAAASMSEVAKITSTWNNVTKAIHMNRWNELLDRKGAAIIEKDFNPATEIATAIGFNPREVNMTYDLEAINRANQDYRNKLATEITYLMHQYANTVRDTNYEDVDEEVLNYYQQAISMRYSLARNENEEQAIRSTVSNRIQTGNDRYSRALREWVRNRSDDEAGRLSEYMSKAQARPFTVDIPGLEEEEE